MAGAGRWAVPLKGPQMAGLASLRNWEVHILGPQTGHCSQPGCSPVMHHAQPERRVAGGV